jgi:hypothetical protein
MKNYRIKKVIEPGWLPFYYPQRKVLGLFWVDMFSYNPIYVGFLSYEDANKALRDAIAPKVEYLDVNCEGIQND